MLCEPLDRLWNRGYYAIRAVSPSASCPPGPIPGLRNGAAPCSCGVSRHLFAGETLPPGFPSDCSFTAAHDVSPGGSLGVAVVSPPGFQIQTAASGGSCSPAGPRAVLSASLTLSCASGLTAGTAISLTVDTFQRSPFALTLQLTYDADGPAPVVDTLMLGSATPAASPVTYQAGWNLIGGPEGILLQGTLGPLYTFRTGDSSYEVLASDTALQAGVGYWSYFPSATTVALPPVAPEGLTISLPPDQWIMLGNPFDDSVTFSPAVGTNLTLVGYNASTGEYIPLPPAPCCQLGPGLGAWGFSSNGGSVNISLGAGPP